MEYCTRFPKGTQRPLKPLVSFSNKPETWFPPVPREDFFQGDSVAERSPFGFAGISSVLSHWPQKPILTPVSHLAAVQISTITPTITVLHFLVLTAASPGHVLLTSSSSSEPCSWQGLGGQEVTLKENRRLAVHPSKVLRNDSGRSVQGWPSLWPAAFHPSPLERTCQGSERTLHCPFQHSPSLKDKKNNRATHPREGPFTSSCIFTEHLLRARL